MTAPPPQKIRFKLGKNQDEQENEPAIEDDDRPPGDEAPDRPQPLHALEMLDVAPARVAPCPFSTLGAEHEDHHHIDQRNEHQQRDVSLVDDAPDPVEQERAPVPAPDFRRNDRALALA